MRIVRWARVAPSCCVVLCLALAGCSDSKKSDTVAATATSTTAAVVTSTPHTVDTRFTGEGSADFCQFITAFSQSQQGVTPSASPASLETAFRDSLDAIDQAVAVAPAEIKPDVVNISNSFKTVQAAAAEAGFDISKMSQSSLGALQNQNFLDSVTRLQAYLTNVCHTG
jgi:hypothetical protein